VRTIPHIDGKGRDKDLRTVEQVGDKGKGEK
jgi:hypothetical protein